MYFQRPLEKVLKTLLDAQVNLYLFFHISNFMTIINSHA